jgi:hypothetical protein
MGLPAGQQRVLTAIEDALQASEPRLASMYAIFARLTRGESGPEREQIDAPGWRDRLTSFARGPWGRAARRRPHRGRPRWQALPRALLLGPLVAVLAAGVLVGISATSGRVTCGSGSAASAAMARAHVSARAHGSGCPAQAGHWGTFLTAK